MEEGGACSRGFGATLTCTAPAGSAAAAGHAALACGGGGAAREAHVCAVPGGCQRALPAPGGLLPAAAACAIQVPLWLLLRVRVRSVCEYIQVLCHVPTLLQCGQTRIG